MTAVNTPDRETLDPGVSTYSPKTKPGLHWDDAVAQGAAALLETERAEEAETSRQAKNREFSASLQSMWSCPVCGQTAMNKPPCATVSGGSRPPSGRTLPAVKPLPGGGDRRAGGRSLDGPGRALTVLRPGPGARARPCR